MIVVATHHKECVDKDANKNKPVEVRVRDNPHGALSYASIPWEKPQGLLGILCSMGLFGEEVVLHVRNLGGGNDQQTRPTAKSIAHSPARPFVSRPCPMVYGRPKSLAVELPALYNFLGSFHFDCAQSPMGRSVRDQRRHRQLEYGEIKKHGSQEVMCRTTALRRHKQYDVPLQTASCQSYRNPTSPLSVPPASNWCARSLKCDFWSVDRAPVPDRFLNNVPSPNC